MSLVWLRIARLSAASSRAVGCGSDVVAPSRTIRGRSSWASVSRPGDGPVATIVSWAVPSGFRERPRFGDQLAADAVAVAGRERGAAVQELGGDLLRRVRPAWDVERAHHAVWPLIAQITRQPGDPACLRTPRSSSVLAEVAAGVLHGHEQRALLAGRVRGLGVHTAHILAQAAQEDHTGRAVRHLVDQGGGNALRSKACAEPLGDPATIVGDHQRAAQVRGAQARRVRRNRRDDVAHRLPRRVAQHRRLQIAERAELADVRDGDLGQLRQPDAQCREQFDAGQ